MGRVITLSSYTTVAELDKAYSELRDSLKQSGLPYDDAGLMGAWAEAVADMEAEQAKPRDFSQL